MRTSLFILLALCATLIAPVVTHAASLPAPAPPRDGVHPGDLVVTAIPVLPAGAREFELLLLPDDGRAIAVSPELPAGVRSVTWRMPRTFSGRARLALRVGTAHDERETAPSEAFSLAPLAPADFLLLVSGRAEIRAWSSGSIALRSTLTSADSPDEWTCAAPAPQAAPPPPAPAIPLPERARAVFASESCAPPSPSIQNTFARTLAWTPLRN